MQGQQGQDGELVEGEADNLALLPGLASVGEGFEGEAHVAWAPVLLVYLK